VAVRWQGIHLHLAEKLEHFQAGTIVWVVTLVVVLAGLLLGILVGIVPRTQVEIALGTRAVVLELGIRVLELDIQVAVGK